MTTYRPPTFQRLDWETAVEESGLPPSQKKALLAVGSYVGWAAGEDNHGITWVSQGVVSQRAGLARETANRAVRAARKLGLLVDLGCKCGKEGRCVARGHTRLLGVGLGSVTGSVPGSVTVTQGSNTNNTTDGQVVRRQLVVEGRTESKSRAPSTEGQGQGRTTGENLTDDEDVDGPANSMSDLPEVAWTCRNCRYPSWLVRDRCPRCDDSRLDNERDVAALLAWRTRSWDQKQKPCIVDGCSNPQLPSADLCDLHYFEKQNMQCGESGCTDLGALYEPGRREDGFVPRRCPEHVAAWEALRQGEQSGDGGRAGADEGLLQREVVDGQDRSEQLPTVRLEGEHGPDRWPAELPW